MAKPRYLFSAWAVQNSLASVLGNYIAISCRKIRTSSLLTPRRFARKRILVSFSFFVVVARISVDTSHPAKGLERADHSHRLIPTAPAPREFTQRSSITV